MEACTGFGRGLGIIVAIDKSTFAIYNSVRVSSSAFQCGVHYAQSSKDRYLSTLQELMPDGMARQPPFLSQPSKAEKTRPSPACPLNALIFHRAIAQSEFALIAPSAADHDDSTTHLFRVMVNFISSLEVSPPQDSETSAMEVASPIATRVHEGRHLVDAPALNLPLIAIDPTGDLFLQVGSSSSPSINDTPSNTAPAGRLPPNVTFQVHSRNLANASQPLEKMLYGGFVESRREHSNEPWIVKLPDDDPDGWQFLLKILHLDWKAATDFFDSVAMNNLKSDKETSAKIMETLYDITVILDKYDFIQVLKP